MIIFIREEKESMIRLLVKIATGALPNEAKENTSTDTKPMPAAKNRMPLPFSSSL
jgi:hypothetical protein